jgi:O-acetyl-ADP-ribose deacetylase (regulator of RNase III)
MQEAAPVALQTVIDYLRQGPEIKLVRFVLFGRGAYQAYAAALKTLMPDQMEA